MPSKKSPARTKAAAKKKAATKRSPAKKKSPAKKSSTKSPAKKPGKQPAKRPAKKAAPVEEASPLEQRIAATHAEVQENGAIVETADDAVWDVNSAPVSAPEPPDDDEADHAVQGLQATALSTVVHRALRFVSKESPFVHVFATCIIGSGPRGIVLHPCQIDGLAPEGHVVDGFRLERMLKNAGKDARLRQTGTKGLQVIGDGHRFNLAPALATVAQPQFPDPSTYKPFDPRLFKQAALFAGDDNIEPAQFAGVQIDEQGVSASDRISLFAGQGGVEGLNVVVPSNAFKDIDEACWVSLDGNGNLFIAISSTGEYRMVSSYGDSLPDVRGVLQYFEPEFRVAVPRRALMDALRSCAIVQKKASAIRLHIFQNDEGPQLEVQAGVGTESQFFKRMSVAFQGSPVLPGGAATGGMAKISVSAAYLQRAAAAYPDPNVVLLGFGGQEGKDIGLQPVVVGTDTFKCAVQPMR